MYAPRREGAPIVDRAYVDALRSFSSALDGITAAALAAALRATFHPADGDQLVVPVAPLVLGGDDLTLFAAGAPALKLTREYLEQFRYRSGEHDTVAAILARRFPALAGEGRSQLGACAGVAVIKPHFPFSVAYTLAEQLTGSAKALKDNVVTRTGVPVPATSLDFLIHHAGSASDLDEIRARTRAPDGGTLHARPYVVTPLSALDGHAESLEWGARTTGRTCGRCATQFATTRS